VTNDYNVVCLFKSNSIHLFLLFYVLNKVAYSDRADLRLCMTALRIFIRHKGSIDIKNTH